MRSETKKSERPSALHCGLMLLPPSKVVTVRISRVSTSISARRISPKLKSPKSVTPRSVTKAMVRPSGEYAGCRSAKRSLVSGVERPDSTSIAYRSLIPPRSPETTMVRPSGDQVGLVISLTPGIENSRSLRALSTSSSTTTSRPFRSALKAKRAASGDQVPAELM